MGKIIDAGIVSEVKFPYIKLSGGYNGRVEGCFSIEASHDDTIDLSIWKSGTYVIGCFEESEGDWGYITAVTKEIYDAKINGDEEVWSRLVTDEWHKHLGNTGYKRLDNGEYKEVCTVRQLSIIGCTDFEYKQNSKLFDVKNDLANAIFMADGTYEDLRDRVVKVYNKHFGETNG